MAGDDRAGIIHAATRTTTMLHPRARALLDLIEERGLPPMHTLTPAEARAFYRDRRAFTQPEPPEVGEVRELQRDGPHGADPAAPLPAAARQRDRAASLPVLVYYHGGGWIDRRPRHARRAVPRSSCNGAGCAVVAVDYRHGPGAPLPGRGRRLPRRDALGARAMRASSASTQRAWRSAATAPAATSPRSSRSPRATPATCRSPSSC